MGRVMLCCVAVAGLNVNISLALSRPNDDREIKLKLYSFIFTLYFTKRNEEDKNSLYILSCRISFKEKPCRCVSVIVGSQEKKEEIKFLKYLIALEELSWNEKQTNFKCLMLDERAGEFVCYRKLHVRKSKILMKDLVWLIYVVASGRIDCEEYPFVKRSSVTLHNSRITCPSKIISCDVSDYLISFSLF